MNSYLVSFSSEKELEAPFQNNMIIYIIILKERKQGKRGSVWAKDRIMDYVDRHGKGRYARMESLVLSVLQGQNN
jgi:hypothetical protein